MVPVVLAQWRARLSVSAAAVALAALAGCSSISLFDTHKLSGGQEVPPVETQASGRSMIDIAADGSVSGRVTTAAIVGTAAHIHQAAAGENGPVIVPLEKSGDSDWVVPAGAKLTPAQLEAYKAGKLYVNVHSGAHKGGEIRTQLKP